ncbi:MAG: N-6 DNA methylase [Fibromonadaceae bacterium]|nr:N-6 DNA methylase [Fibromonadaceae bacterium]
MGKNEIQKALEEISTTDLTEKIEFLLKVIGLQSSRKTPLQNKTFEEFSSQFITENSTFRKDKAFVENWNYIDFIFQITSGELESQLNFSKNTFDKNETDAYLFFCLELKEKKTEYSRSILSQITREINKIFSIPTFVIFKIGDKITFSIINRRISKRDESKDVLEKVTLIKDINTKEPHRAHIDILFYLSIEQLRTKYVINSFADLHNAWQKVLDIKTLNRSFYEKLVAKIDKEGNITKKGWYFKCLENIQIDDELKAQAVIRVIIRLMFMWFMKEKKMIKPDFFTRKFAADFLKNKNTYYNAVLQNMFFAVLNTKISERRFLEQNEYDMFQFFRYETFFKQGKAIEFKQLTDEIPFINGGIFTCHDQQIKQSISDDIIFELIDLFNSFVFTVEESTPVEQDIALDPELLGTVFENLIAFYNLETQKNARKQTGSFYTPREIVDYMCSESLKKSLKAKFPDLHLQIDKLIDSDEDYLNFPDKNKMLAAITDLKILDPACGSGAFPMGMFNLMVRTVEKLRKYKTTYENKLDIISNCIYGIDIQNIAIEISKLRFFISLLVDYQIPEKVEDFDVLPNLETKFIVADALINIKLQGGGSPFFNSQIMFGIRDGFDIVIGNPPYLFLSGKGSPIKQLENANKYEEANKLKLLFNLYANQLPNSSEGCRDYYKWFIDKAFGLVKPNGIVAYITPNTYIDLKNYSDIRKILFTENMTDVIVDLGFGIFEELIVPSAIFISKRSKLNQKDVSYCDLKNIERNILKERSLSQLVESYKINILIKENKILLYKHPLAEKIYSSCSLTIKKLLTLSEGEHNMIIDNNKMSYKPREGMIAAILDEELSRYVPVKIVYIPQNDCKKYDVNLHSGNRFFIRKTGDSIIVAPINNDNLVIAHQNVYVGHSRLNEMDFRFLIGLLNSSLLTFLYQNGINGQKGRTLAQFRIYSLYALPIPDKFPIRDKQEIISLVEKIISLKEENPAADTKKFEGEIDRLVYGLYGLNPPPSSTLPSYPPPYPP